MKLPTLVIFEDRKILETEISPAVCKGDTIVLDLEIYVVVEKGFIIAGSADRMFIAVEELEGQTRAPTGKYDWLDAVKKL